MRTGLSCILLTVDVEDWFQVENLRASFPHRRWSSCELRVESNVHRLLDLFDSAGGDPTRSLCFDGTVEEPHALSGQGGIRATFFVLGWLAERLPHLVREIHRRGHEVASHGFNHRLCTLCGHEELERDLADSRRLLEDTIGAEICGYRAPSFSVSEEMLKTLEQCGYRYDSSYNSFQFNRRHGSLNCRMGSTTGLAMRRQSGLFELPVSNLDFGPVTLPTGGGGYFRMIPFAVFRVLVSLMLERHGAYLFYIHPWEVDPGQPRVEDACWFSRFRHYTNLRRTMQKLEAFLGAFRYCRFLTCRHYLDSLEFEWSRHV